MDANNYGELRAVPHMATKLLGKQGAALEGVLREVQDILCVEGRVNWGWGWGWGCVGGAIILSTD
jgi:hypothetical protein